MHTIETIILFLCSLFPMFHIINSFPLFRKKPYYLTKKNRETIGMSILIPCYNESKIVETAIEGLQKLEYEKLEVIFINDGSQDNTLELFQTHLQLVPIEGPTQSKLTYKPIIGYYQSQRFPWIYVLDKVNGGKADSLNAAIDHSSQELVITLDADSILAPNTLEIINNAFGDPDLVAAGGMVHILQGESMENMNMKGKNIVRLQIFEYLKGFYILKTSLAKVNSLAIISGAFGIFKRNFIQYMGGFRNTLGEDIDITLKFQQYLKRRPKKKILFIPEAVCYTECPESWRDLFKQRVRWQKAFIDCIFQYWRFLSKTFLTRGVSFFMLLDSFIVGTLSNFFICSIILVFPFISLHQSLKIVLTYLIGSLFFNTIYNFYGYFIAWYYGVRFKGWNKLRLLWTMLLDVLFFRFYAMYIILHGTVAYIFNQHSWNKVNRTGRTYQLEQK